MAKKNVSEIERGVGYFMGVVTNLMDIVREKSVPFEAIYRLATPAGRATLEMMVETANAEWLAEQPKPREQTGSPHRGGPSSEKLDRITVPNRTAAELCELAQTKLNLTYLSPDLAKWGFVTDEAGKTYEVMVWTPRRNVSTDEVRKYFPKGFTGNTAAFVALMTEKNPMGWHVSIPEDNHLIPFGGDLCAPYFRRGDGGGDLGLDHVDGAWDGYYSFVAFREVTVTGK